jgi:hypothetical protein
MAEQQTQGAPEKVEVLVVGFQVQRVEETSQYKYRVYI